MAQVNDGNGDAIMPTLIPPETEAPSFDTLTTTKPQRRTGEFSSSTSVPGLTRSDTDFTGSELHTPALPSPVASIDNGKRKSVPLKLMRPTLPTKAGTEAPRKALRGSFARPQRALTSRKTSVQNGNLRFDIGRGAADSDSSSDSSSNEEDPRSKMEEKSTKRSKDNDQADRYSRFNIKHPHFKTRAKVRKNDGRLNLHVNEQEHAPGYLAKALGTGFRHDFFKEPAKQDSNAQDDAAEALPDNMADFRSVPRMNICIIVIGSRGDIQPFIKVGKILRDECGHRVRIATHPTFKDFVEKDSGLEFFSVGGNPSELMAFMVKNPGLVPSLETVFAGEIGKKRADMSEMFEGMWRACINATDDETDKQNMRMMGDKSPFVADAIIANPPSFAHIHIAERLGVPLHLMFTFPYTPTTQFPHPLANIKSTNVDNGYTNFMSYPLVDLMTWQGLGDLVNKFRVNTLGLEPVSTLWAPGQLYRLKVPYTYMWSPGLVPKPRDYGPEIDIGGFVFLELADSFKPPESLVKFLDAGPPPVYIGFGSIVVDDPNAFTNMIFEAVKMAGVRALVSKGWGGIGGNDLDVPDNVYLLDNTPHDWLFPKVSAVVHHGGAGTTAMGLKCARPTMIVPFFGDQPFWGSMVAKKRAGAFECIPYKRLTAEKLAQGIEECLTDEAKENVAKIAESIEKEGDGAMNAVRSFHRHLILRGSDTIRCSILENRVAVWQIKNLGLQLSALAADMLAEQKKLRWKDLRLVRHYEYNDFEGAGEPITGVTGSLFSTITNAGKGIASIPVNATHSIKSRKQHHDKKKRIEEQRKKLNQQDDNATWKASNGTNEASAPGGRKATGLQRTETGLSTISADPTEPLAEELAEETGHGLLQTGGAIAKAPMDLALGLAQGFHNAPRLYGDNTVRRPVRISGFHSGLRAGRRELMYGVYDGFTGVVMQPYRGAKEHGVVGALEGVAIGLGGLVLKNISAIVGPPAYIAKGIHKEMVKTKQPTKFLRKARILQGGMELRALQAAASTKGESARQIALNSIYAPLEGETLDSVERSVDEGWKIMMQLLEAVEKKKSEGPLKIKGRVGFKLTEKKWRESGALESVRTAELALKARREGKDVGEEMRKHRIKEVETRRKSIKETKSRSSEESLAKSELGGMGLGEEGISKEI